MGDSRHVSRYGARTRNNRSGTGSSVSEPRLAKLAGLVLVCSLELGAAMVGCSGIKNDGRAGTGGAAPLGGSGGTSGRVGTGGMPSSPGSGGAGGTTSSPAPSDGGQDGGQILGCDGGDACMCPRFKLAVIGKPGKWGANPNGDPDTALQDWLNSSSAGTARVDNFTNRVTLTADFLAAYNVIILASLSDDSNMGPWWTYSDAEVAAFQAWIQNGGGVISLTGYASGDEMAADNQLIGFSGITYNSDGVWGACVDWTICNC